MEERSIMLHIKNVEKIKEILPNIQHGDITPKSSSNFVLCTFTANNVIECVRTGIFFVQKVEKSLCTVLGKHGHYTRECMILYVNAFKNIIPVVVVPTFDNIDSYGFLDIKLSTKI